MIQFLTGLCIGGMGILVYFFREDRESWRKKCIEDEKQISVLQQALYNERAEANRKALAASYEHGCYDARETDAVYRELMRKTRSGNTLSSSNCKIIPLPGTTVS